MDTQNEHKKSNARLGSSPQNDRRRLSNPQGCLITAISTTASALEEDKRPFVTDKSKETHAPESAPSNMYPLSGLDREAHGEETERREREGLEVSECRLSVSVTVVGGVELDDARLEESSVAISIELLLSMAASRDDSMASM